MDLLLKTFQSGELSPQMKGRTDLPEYHGGCRTMQGFVPSPTGSAVRCPGFEKVAEVADSKKRTRLVPFVHRAIHYILEFGDEVMRVYKNDSLVLDGAEPYERETPWSSTEIFDLVFAPRGQAIWHPDHDIYRLTCEGDTDWTLTAANFGRGPFQTENENIDLTITPSETTGDITLTASGDVFTEGHVGALVTLTHFVSEARISDYWIAPSTSDPLSVQGDWEFYALVPVNTIVYLERSFDGGTTWDIYKTYEWSDPRYVYWAYHEFGYESADSILYRVRATGTCNFLYFWLVASAHYQKGVARITKVNSEKLADATVLYILGGTAATWQWSIGSWSTVLGYPRCGCIHEGRICSAGTANQPATIWSCNTFKRIGDSDMMTFGAKDHDAFTRTIDLADCNEIRWLSSMWVMLVGMDGGIAKGIGPDQYHPMTPKDANFFGQTGMGSSALQPVMVAGQLVYAGRNGKRVYEMTYSDDARTYSPEDLTRFAEHITGSGIGGWAFQQQPYAILWAWTTDGALIGLVRDRQMGLMGWFRRLTDGSFEDVIVNPGVGNDEVWTVVARDVNGETKRYVERMKDFEHWTDQADCFYLDGGTKWDGGASVAITGIAVDADTKRVTVTAASHGFSNGWTVKLAGVTGMADVNGKVYTVADKADNTFVLKTRDGSAYIDGSGFAAYVSGGAAARVTNGLTGLTHLAAETVSVLLDGQPGTGTVTQDGVYTIGLYDRHYYNTIIVGRPYTSVLEPMPIEQVAGYATLQGRLKKIVSCGIRFYRTAGGKLGTDSTDVGNIDYRKPGDLAGADKVLVSEDVFSPGPGGWQEQGHLRIETDSPLPMTVSAIVLEVEA